MFRILKNKKGDLIWLSMGAIDVVKIRGGVELGFEEEPEILAIEEAVRVLLQGLCDDSNRDGVRKTPLRLEVISSMPTLTFMFFFILLFISFVLSL